MFNISIKFFLIVVFGLAHFHDCANLKNSNQKFDKKLCECNNKIEIEKSKGTTVKKSELKFVVSIFQKLFNDTFRHTCTGVLLNPSFVLSAGSGCVEAVFIANRSALVGAGLNHDLMKYYESKDNVRHISNIHVPVDMKSVDFKHGNKSDQFDQLLINNIGIYELSSPFELGDSTQIYPACLSTRDKRTYRNENFITASWGVHERIALKIIKCQRPVTDSGLDLTIHSSNVEDKLVSYNLKQVNKTVYDMFKPTPDFVLEYDNFTVCLGETGSPILDGKHNQIVGILNAVGKIINETSVPPEIIFCDQEAPVFATSIDHHLDWIKSIAKDDLCTSA